MGFGPKRTFIPTTGNNLVENNFFALGGLNLYAPDELLQNNESPYGKNFRIFQDDALDSRVSISKRNGTANYSVPLGETDRGSEITATNGDQTINLITQFAQVFTVSAAGRLTKVKLQLKNDNSGTGPLIVRIYSEVSSAPGAVLATSSIPSSGIIATYAYVDVNFIEAPVVATTTNYWIVVSQQSEGTGDYKISSTTNATTALTSTNSGNTWAATTYALNYYVYVSTNSDVKGIHRYYKTTTTPVTLFVSNTVLYSVNDTTGATTSIGTGFNASATNYRFVTADDIVYIVNGVDVPKKWNGTTFASMGGSPQVGIDICVHKNKIFILGIDNKLIWSTLANLESFVSTDYWYIPAPKTSDDVFSITPFQDMLVIFNRGQKWLFYGDNINNMQLKPSPAGKGCVGLYASCVDGNFLYFVSDDNDVYAYNGGTDKSIGDKISRELEGVSNLTNVKLIVHDGKLRLYYSPSGQSTIQNCLIFDLTHSQWMMDTNLYSGHATVFNSQTDSQVLVHGSSLVGALYYGDSGTSDIGKPILFEYRTKYISFGHPSMKHRIKRLYPFFRAGTGPYYIDVQIDIDSRNQPNSNLVYLGVTGAVWGTIVWGSAVWGGGSYQPKKISIPGQAATHQIRFVQNGAYNPVDILGYSTYTKLRRPI